MDKQGKDIVDQVAGKLNATPPDGWNIVTIGNGKRPMILIQLPERTHPIHTAIIVKAIDQLVIGAMHEVTGHEYTSTESLVTMDKPKRF